jgi:hypothetical protein
VWFAHPAARVALQFSCRHAAVRCHHGKRTEAHPRLPSPWRERLLKSWEVAPRKWCRSGRSDGKWNDTFYSRRKRGGRRWRGAGRHFSSNERVARSLLPAHPAAPLLRTGRVPLVPSLLRPYVRCIRAASRLRAPIHANSIYALHDCSVFRWPSRRHERGDMAERVRL